MKRQITKRNIQIIQLMANGLTLIEVAQTLRISINTVKAHLRRIYVLTGVQNSNELIAWGFRNGLIK